MGVRLLVGDCRDLLATLPLGSVQCCVSSPPYYGLRDYGVAGQIGLEPTPNAYVAELVAVFREVRRVLADDGVLWLNLGDSYAGSGRGGHGGALSTLEGSTEAQDEARRAAASRAVAGRHGPACQAGVIGRAWVPPPAGLKPKDLIGIPWLVAFALRADGWYLRSEVIWHKPNPMPESVRDRPTKAHEQVFLLSKSERYRYDADAIAEPAIFGEPNSPQAIKSPFGQGYARRAKRGVPPRHAAYASSDQSGLDHVGRGMGRNARTVWTIATRPFAEAHVATFPAELAERCIRAGSRKGDMVLDPFAGAGTTLLAADGLQRDAVGIELNPGYAAIARERIVRAAPLLAEVAE